MKLKVKKYSPGVYGVNKPVSLTPAQAIFLLKEQEPSLKESRLTYAGRLDPMAEGLLLLLDSQIQKNKNDFLKLDKTYTASVLLGFETDSFDLLGIPKKGKNSKVTKTQVLDALEKITGNISLHLPIYSSPPVNGKPLFTYAQNSQIKQKETPLRASQVYNSSLISLRTIAPKKLLSYIEKTVTKVQGDFRITKITSTWKKLLSKQDSKNLQILTLDFSVSHGTYIRSIAQELGKLLGTKACLYSLKRTSVGKYKL